MRRRAVFTLPLALAVGRSLSADPANGDPRKEKLFAMFIAPCCWRENLLAHHSPKADELRAEIKKFIEQGRSDSDIRQAMISQYTTRILAVPDGEKGQWLSWTPPAAAAAGLAILAIFIKRSTRPPAPATPTANLPDLPDSEWD
jgi:cytochrome c-type biogenesis protein CcmH